MKKFLLTTILFISSFFFLCLHDVNAATFTKTLIDEDFSLINKDFLNFRKQVISFCGDSKKYVIYYESGLYHAIIADNDSSYSILFGTNGTQAWFKVNNFDIYTFKDNNMTFKSSISSDTYIYIISTSGSPLLLYLDTNFERISDIPNLNYFVLISYNDKKYNLPRPDSNLYNTYLRNFPPLEPDDPFEEDKGLLLNFYTCIIEKISFLANIFATNFVFLSIICIFVFIFVIDLVRRFIR